MWSWLLSLGIQGLTSWGNCGLIFCMGSGAGWIRLFRHAGVGTNDYSLVITGEAGLVPVLLAENRSMPQGGMEDVCRVVVTMNDPMSHKFSLQVPHNFEELDRLGWGSLHSDGPGHDDLYECPVTLT